MQIPPFQLDSGQTTHLIRVSLKIFLYDFLGGILAFLFFPPLFPFSFPVLQSLHLFLDVPCAITTGNVQNHQKCHMTLIGAR